MYRMIFCAYTVKGLLCILCELKLWAFIYTFVVQCEEYWQNTEHRSYA